MPHETDATYPSQYECETVLRDGSSMLLRPIRQDDIEAWFAFIARLSPHTRYLRLHHVQQRMDLEDAIRFCTVDYKDTFALVAEVIREQRKDIIAVARYYRLPNKRSADVALTIEDIYQGRGIGTKLLECLTDVARDNGIITFEGDVLVENKQMINVIKDYGFHVVGELEAGVYHFTLPITPTQRVIRKEEER